MLSRLSRWIARTSSRRALPPCARLALEILEQRLALSLSAVSDTTTFPFSAVVEMDIVNDGHALTCTGVLLDDTHVLTAAHCLYEVDNGRGPAESVTVYPGRDGVNVRPFGSARGTALVVHPDYVSGPYAGQTAFDLGIVTLDRNVGATAGKFGLLPLYPDSYFNGGGTINILEYPGDSFSGYSQFFATGPAASANTSEISWLQSDLPIEHGASGAPIYVRDGNNRAVVGVVSELSVTAGYGTRITPAKYNWIISQLTPLASSAASSSTPSLQTPAPPASTSTPGVFDPATATWYLHNFNSPGAPDITPFAYGGPGWKPITGDWNGDGSDTVGVVDPATMTWYLRNASAGAVDVTPFPYGGRGWVPLAGDWDGDGTDSIGVFDPATATFYLRNSNDSGAPSFDPIQFGSPGWIPVVGDWNGDGVTTIGVVDPTTMTWYLRNSNAIGPPDLTPFSYGGPGWTPVVGDWDGNRTTSVGVVEPATMLWYLRNSNTIGPPDLTPFSYGAPGWTPVAGDWNGFGGTPRSAGVRVALAVGADRARAYPLDDRALLGVALASQAAREVFSDSVPASVPSEAPPAGSVGVVAENSTGASEDVAGHHQQRETRDDWDPFRAPRDLTA